MSGWTRDCSRLDFLPCITTLFEALSACDGGWRGAANDAPGEEDEHFGRSSWRLGSLVKMKTHLSLVVHPSFAVCIHASWVPPGVARWTSVRSAYSVEMLMAGGELPRT